MKKSLLVVIGTLGFAAAFSQNNSLPIGIDAGLFVPSDSLVRDTFGSTWFRVGITPISFQFRPNDWKFTFDIAYLRGSDQGNRVSLVPVTFGMTRAFGQSMDARPYVAIRLGPYYGDVSAPSLGISKRAVGFDANAAVGVTFGGRFYIEGRYDTMSELSGLKFNGFFFSAGIRLFDIRF